MFEFTVVSGEDNGVASRRHEGVCGDGLFLTVAESLAVVLTLASEIVRNLGPRSFGGTA